MFNRFEKNIGKLTFAISTQHPAVDDLKEMSYYSAYGNKNRHNQCLRPGQPGHL